MVCESQLRWGIFLPNLGTLELFAMYATDGRTDRRTDKSNAYCPLRYGRRHINLENLFSTMGLLLNGNRSTLAPQRANWLSFISLMCTLKVNLNSLICTELFDKNNA